MRNVSLFPRSGDGVGKGPEEQRPDLFPQAVAVVIRDQPAPGLSTASFTGRSAVEARCNAPAVFHQKSPSPQVGGVPSIHAGQNAGIGVDQPGRARHRRHE